MATKDKQRYEREMQEAGLGKSQKNEKDADAPKRPTSSFFLY